MKRGLRDYIAEIKDKTVKYLQSLSVVYCKPGTAIPTVTPYGKSNVFIVPNVDTSDEENLPSVELTRFVEKMQNRSYWLRKNNPCNLYIHTLFGQTLRSSEVNGPTCANNDGGKIVGRQHICVDLWNAIDFVDKHEWKVSTSTIINECGERTTKRNNKDALDILPECEYDCNHPTICVQTGRYVFYFYFIFVLFVYSFVCLFVCIFCLFFSYFSFTLLFRFSFFCFICFFSLFKQTAKLSLKQPTK